MPKQLTESIRFIASEEDRKYLETIAAQDGDYNMSSTLRRMIRSEANRRGIDTTPTPQPQQEAA